MNLFARASLLTLYLMITLLMGKAYAAESAVAESANKSELSVGIFPRRSAHETVEKFSPMIKYLEESLNRPIKLVVSKDYSSFTKKLHSGEFDLVHLNQYDYIKIRQELNYEVVAQNEEFGSETIRSAIYVKKDSGIKNLQDIKGKKVSFGGSKKALVSYIVPTVMLSEAGLQRGHDYKERIVKNPPNAVINNYLGLTEASAAGDKVLNLPLVKRMIKGSDMHAIAYSKELPHLPWAVKASAGQKYVDEIRDVLLRMASTENGRKALKAAVLTGLNRAIDSDYDHLREIIEKSEQL